MNYKDVVELANKRADENYLGRDEEGFCKYRLDLHSHAVHIVHEEGTTLFFESANAEKFEKFWLIYTEHHGVFVYHEDDVLVYRYKRIWNDGDEDG